MQTVVGTGASSATDTQRAIREAAQEARGALGSRAVSFGFVFAGPEHNLSIALQTAKAESQCATLLGASTAGEFTERGLTHGGVAVMFVACEGVTCRTGLAKGLAEDPARVASELGKAASANRPAAKDQRRLTTVLLTDGLTGKGEDLVLALHEHGQASQIVGGAAGDEGAFKETQVGCGSEAAVNAAAALHVFSPSPWGVGVGHGLRPTTKPMRVTKASGNIVRQVNNAPAFDIYKAHAAQRGVRLTQANASQYMIANELGIHFFDKVSRARAPLSVSADGSLTCAAAIPEGAMISILDGDPDSMVSAASSAADEAREHLEGGTAAGVLVFDCVCRGMILKEDFKREIAAVRRSFPDAPIAGFLTYGEIARYAGRLEGWHNTTAVVVAIPA